MVPKQRQNEPATTCERGTREVSWLRKDLTAGQVDFETEYLGYTELPERMKAEGASLSSVVQSTSFERSQV